MTHVLWLGILLGMGAAIPIGPVNLEIIRRNLRFGSAFGVALGLGACLADITFLFLLSLGALSLLQFPQVLRSFAFAGSLILIWFAINAFRATTTENIHHPATPSLPRYFIEGYFITLINPYTILFWASISSQLSLSALSLPHAMLYAGFGVIIGTVSWVLLLNGLLHVTRHRLSNTVMKWLNYVGGVILLSFACIGIMRASLIH